MGIKRVLQIFYILCVCIDHAYIQLYIWSKIITNSLMRFKIWCQLGLVVKKSKLPLVGDFSFLGLKVRFWNTRTWYNFRNHTGTPNECGIKERRSSYKLLSVSTAGFTQRGEKRRVYGWDGMGRNIKIVLQCYSYFVGI